MFSLSCASKPCTGLSTETGGKVRIVGNGMKLSARVRVKSNDSHRREAKKHSRRQSTYYGHTQNGI